MIKAPTIISIIEDIERELLAHDSLVDLIRYFKQKFRQTGSEITHGDSLLITARNKFFIKEKLDGNNYREVMRLYGHKINQLISKSKYRESKNFETDKDSFCGVDVVFHARHSKSNFLKKQLASEELFWISIFYTDKKPDYIEIVTSFSVVFKGYFEFYDMFNFKNEYDEYNLKYPIEELEIVIGELKHYIDNTTKALRIVGNL